MTTIPYKLKVISRNEEPFVDRVEAGALLAEALFYLKGPNTVVLGIAGGGIIVARQVAHDMEAPLDIVLTRKIELRDKDVIVVDDGSAMGSTVQAAFWNIRQERPRRLIGAFPVGEEAALLSLSEYADEILCLKVPSVVQSIGRFYIDFEQVSEENILDVLNECGRV